MLRTCRGPAYSTDINVKGGLVDTREDGKSGWLKG